MCKRERERERSRAEPDLLATFFFHGSISKLDNTKKNPTTATQIWTKTKAQVLKTFRERERERYRERCGWEGIPLCNPEAVQTK